MLVVTRHQIEKLSSSCHERKSAIDIRDAVAAWMAFRKNWDASFKPENRLSLEQTYKVSKVVRRWSLKHGFEKHSHYVALVVLVLKAIHLGVSKAYIKNILDTVDTLGSSDGEIEQALTFINYYIDAEIDINSMPI